MFSDAASGRKSMHRAPSGCTTLESSVRRQLLAHGSLPARPALPAPSWGSLVPTLAPTGLHRPMLLPCTTTAPPPSLAAPKPSPLSAWTRRGGLKTRHSGGGCRRSPQCPHRGSSSGKIGGQNLREVGHHVETQLASPAWHCRSFWRMRGCVRGDLFFSSAVSSAVQEGGCVQDS